VRKHKFGLIEFELHKYSNSSIGFMLKKIEVIEF